MRISPIIVFAAACGLALRGLAAAPEFVVIEAREIDLSFPAEAVVEAVRQATVAAQVQGRIVEVRVDAGQRVKAGQVMMRVDQREAVQNLDGARASLGNAKAGYDRTRDLFAKKFVSQAALDKAEADYKMAAAAADQAGTLATFSTIAAPISGLVAERHVELGEMAAPGKPLVTLFDPKGLRVVAEIPEYRLAAVKGTARARIEFPDSGRWVDAARVEVLPTADVRSHSVRARLYLPDGIAGVIPGMYARVHFAAGKAKKMTVPQGAVLRRGDVAAVYVLDRDNVPHLRQVRLGEAVASGDLEVLAGLSAGERVALDPVKSGIRLIQGSASAQK